MTAHSRLRHLAVVQPSNVNKKVVEEEVAVRLCNYVDVYYNESIGGDLDFMPATASSSQVAQFTLRSGDILITKDSETPDDIAVPAYVPYGLPGVVCGYHLSVIRVDPRIMHSKFMFWFLSSSVARGYFSANAQGVTRFGLRRDTFLDLKVPLFDLSEQAQIVEFLDSQVAAIDKLVELDRRPSPATLEGHVGDLIDLLRERRQALITAAVTGQLEIPEWLREA